MSSKHASSPAKKASLSPTRASPRTKKASLLSPAKKASPSKASSLPSSSKADTLPLIIPSSNPSSPCKYDTDTEISALAKSVSVSLYRITDQESDVDFKLPEITDRLRSPRKNQQAPNSPIISPKRAKFESPVSSPQKVKCSQPEDNFVKPAAHKNRGSGDADPSVESQMSFHPGRDDYDVISADQSRGLFAEDVEDAEIWLVQAPSSIDIEKLSSVHLEFEGQQVLRQKTKSTKGGPDTMRISYCSSKATVGRLNMVLPSRESKRWEFVSQPFAGKVAISHEYTVPEPTYPTPSSPSFDLPDGLKLRYVPFGCGGTDDVISAGQDERGDIPESADDSQTTKKKKKKKKKKKMKVDSDD